MGAPSQPREFRRRWFGSSLTTRSGGHSEQARCSETDAVSSPWSPWGQNWSQGSFEVGLNSAVNAAGWNYQWVAWVGTPGEISGAPDPGVENPPSGGCSCSASSGNLFIALLLLAFGARKKPTQF